MIKVIIIAGMGLVAAGLLAKEIKDYGEAVNPWGIPVCEECMNCVGQYGECEDCMERIDRIPK